MLIDLTKYISDTCTLSEEEQFIRYIIQHCRNQSIKNLLIEGIRSNAADLIYDHDRLFHFFDGDQHQYDLFDGSELDVSIPLLAYLYCMFDEGEFHLQGTSVEAIEFYNFYINYPDPLKRSKQMVKELKNILIKNSAFPDSVVQSFENEDSDKIYDSLEKSGWYDWYIDTTELFFSEELKKKIPHLCEEIQENLGLAIDDEGIAYNWCVTPCGQENQDGEPEKDLLALIETAENVRANLERNNIESELPYKDVIRVFEDAGENNELILSISSIHESEREVLF